MSRLEVLERPEREDLYRKPGGRLGPWARHAVPLAGKIAGHYLKLGPPRVAVANGGDKQSTCARTKCECTHKMKCLAVRHARYLVSRPGGTDL